MRIQLTEGAAMVILTAISPIVESPGDESDTDSVRIPYTLSPLDSCRGGHSGRRRQNRRRQVRNATQNSARNRQTVSRPRTR